MVKTGWLKKGAETLLRRSCDGYQPFQYTWKTNSSQRCQVKGLIGEVDEQREGYCI